MYARKDRVAKYLKQKVTELKEEMDTSSMIDEEFNIPLSTIDRKKQTEISPKIENLTISSTNRI